MTDTGAQSRRTTRGAAAWPPPGPAAAPLRVALVHGVGFGPETLGPLAAELAARGAEPLVVPRRGYGERAGLAPPEHVAEHVADVVAGFDGAGLQRAVVAGMSGGATIALALALARPERLVCAIAHEPAVGRFSPELRAGIAEAMRSAGGVGLARMLAGERTWAGLSAHQRALVGARAGLIEADAGAFMRFEPDPASLTRGPPLVCTVGAHSDALRWAVAERLASASGAPLLVIDGCGHLPQLDAPAAFAAAIVGAARARGSTPSARPLDPMPT